MPDAQEVREIKLESLAEGMTKWFDDKVRRDGPPSKETAAEAPNLSTREKKFKDSLAEALKSGEIDTRSNLAQKMEREMSKKESSKYHALTTLQKADFRKAWAETKYKQFEAGSEQSESWRTVDKECGTYMSVSMAFQKQGGSEEDVAPTKRLIEKAYAMGEPWIWWNWQTERYDVFVLENTHTEVFEQAWRKYQKNMTEGQIPEAAQKNESSSDATDTKQEKGEGSTKRKASEGEGAPTKQEKSGKQTGSPALKRATSGTLGDPAEQDERNKLKGALAAALKTKKAITTATSATNNMMAQLSSDPSWGWANTPNILKEVKDVQSMLEKNMTSFARKFLCQEVSVVKKTYREGDWMDNLLKFSRDLDGRVEDLSNATNISLAMQAARTKVPR